MADTKPGVKTTEFWAAIGIAGLPIADQAGWFDKMPVTQGGETALWFSAGLIVATYILSRSLIKIATLKYGVKNETNETPASVPTSGILRK